MSVSLQFLEYGIVKYDSIIVKQAKVLFCSTAYLLLPLSLVLLIWTARSFNEIGRNGAVALLLSLVICIASVVGGLIHHYFSKSLLILKQAVVFGALIPVGASAVIFGTDLNGSATLQLLVLVQVLGTFDIRKGIPLVSCVLLLQTLVVFIPFMDFWEPSTLKATDRVSWAFIQLVQGPGVVLITTLLMGYHTSKMKHAQQDLEAKQAQLVYEQQVTTELLHNALPTDVADLMEESITKELQNAAPSSRRHSAAPATLKALLREIPRVAYSYSTASVLFSDIVGFTEICSLLTPQQLMDNLNTLITQIDRIQQKIGVEKIKTIGDCYLSICVAERLLENSVYFPPSPSQSSSPYLREAITDADAACRLLAFGQELHVTASQFQLGCQEVSFRSGIHCGSIVAGVIGLNRVAFDLWGDTVNVAARMESSSFKDKVQMSATFFSLIKEKTDFEIEYRGEIEVKGKGLIHTWLLDPFNQTKSSFAALCENDITLPDSPLPSPVYFSPHLNRCSSPNMMDSKSTTSSNSDSRGASSLLGATRRNTLVSISDDVVEIRL